MTGVAVVGAGLELPVREAGALRFVAGNNLFKHAPALGHLLAADALDDLRPEARLGAA
jgi:sarcosine oxidase